MRIYVEKLDNDTARIGYQFSGWREALAALGETEAQQEARESWLLKNIRSAPVGKMLLSIRRKF